MDSIVQNLARRNASIRELMLHFDFVRWRLQGRPNPPPKIEKYGIIKSCIKNKGFDVVVETGTYLGDFIAHMLRSVQTIYSIEISASLYEKARMRFHASSKVHLILGDTREMLPRILEQVDKPCLFWVDAHRSGGITAGSQVESPVMEEVRVILTHALRHRLDHLVIIDDAKDFVGIGGYPTISAISSLVKGFGERWTVKVSDDMIFIQRTRLLA